MNNFDEMAKNFDTDARKSRSIMIAEEISKHINDGEYQVGMEYGCGTGLVGKQLIDKFERLIFADASAGMVEQIKQKLVAIGKSADDAIQCDLIKELPQGLGVDCIFSSLVLHHIDDTAEIFKRFYNVLNDKGRLIIIDLDSDEGCYHADMDDFEGHNGFKQEDLIDLSKQAGFSEVTIESFYHSTKMAHGEEKPYSFFILDALK